MVPAIMMLGASLRQGDYCRNVQFDTVRKTSFWYGNAHDASAAYLGTTLEDGHLASASPTTGEWYSRQARVTKLGMGVLLLQNKFFTLQMVLVLDDIPEKEGQRSNGDTNHKRIEELMLFVIVVFGAGLR